MCEIEHLNILKILKKKWMDVNFILIFFVLNLFEKYNTAASVCPLE